MTVFTPVFEITRWSNGLLADELFRLSVGVGALFAGVAGFVRAWRGPNGISWGNLVWSLLLTIWAVGWLLMHDFPAMYQRIDRLVTAHEAGGCEVTEGTVSVKHQQPAHGHTSGDRIEVNGREFVVNYFYATPAYRDTIAKGGVLRPGAYVRLCHVDGAIVRVEVGKERENAPLHR